MVEDLDGEHVKIVKNAVSPTTLTDYVPAGTLEPSQFGWAANSGSQFSAMKSSFGNLNNAKSPTRFSRPASKGKIEAHEA
jgi:hypothetical protein